MFHESNFGGSIDSRDREDNKRPLSYAEKIIYTVYNMGEKGLYAYTLSRHPLKTLSTLQYPFTDFDENVVDTSTSCDNGLKYLLMWLGEESIIEDTIKLGYSRTYITDLDTFDYKRLSGLYYVAIDGEQPHAFTWLIKGDKVLYFGSYAGHPFLSLIEEDKETYFTNFIKAMKGDSALWPTIFNEEADEPEVGFINMELVKSKRYEDFKYE